MNCQIIHAIIQHDDQKVSHPEIRDPDQSSVVANPRNGERSTDSQNIKQFDKTQESPVSRFSVSTDIFPDAPAVMVCS